MEKIMCNYFYATWSENHFQLHGQIFFIFSSASFPCRWAVSKEVLVMTTHLVWAGGDVILSKIESLKHCFPPNVFVWKDTADVGVSFQVYIFFFFLLIVTSKNRICICFENFHSKLIHCICIFFNSGRQINVAYRKNKSERYVLINEMNKICTLKILKTLIGCSILYQPSDWLTFSPPKRYVVRRYTTLKDVTLHWKTLRCRISKLVKKSFSFISFAVIEYKWHVLTYSPALQLTIYLENNSVFETILVRGGWSFWSSWSNCPHPNPKDNCGNQFRNRERSCTNPTPTFNGEYCEGAGKEYQNCSFVPCEKEGNVNDISIHYGTRNKLSATVLGRAMY